MRDRKDDHLSLCLNREVTTDVSTGFERYRLVHRALPDLDLDEVSLETSFLSPDQTIDYPLQISGMVGGNPRSKEINLRLAHAAEDYNLPLGVGSQRIAIENPEVEDTFRLVREEAPNAFRIANLGAVQLNYGYGLEEAQRAVAMIEADALALHLNPVQEAVQPEGDTNFKGLLPQISDLCHELDVPVIAKEVGSGISGQVASQLEASGVAALDLQGVGGTSFSRIEMLRSEGDYCQQLQDWGLPTSQCVTQCRQAVSLPLVASGGIRNGIHVLKAIALGANLAGMALPLLKAAHRSEAELRSYLDRTIEEMRIGMFLTGSKKLSELTEDKINQVQR